MSPFKILILFLATMGFGDTLTVGVNSSEPMDIYDSTTGKWSGFDVDLWQAIASKMGVSSRYVSVQEFKDLIPQVAEKKLDVGLSGITITSDREKIIDFSHKYFRSGLAMVVRSDKEPSFCTKLMFYLGIMESILPYFIIYIIFSLIASVIIWLMEQKNDQFGPRMWMGIFNGWYWVNVVLATVGFGDKAPMTKKGKCFCVFLMTVGIFFIMPMITGNITAKLTAQKINGFIQTQHDLKDKDIAVEKGSTSVNAVQDIGGRVIEKNTIKDCCKALLENKVDALVCDVPMAKYLCKINQEIMSLPETFDDQDYGIALQYKSPYRKAINEALLAIEEDGSYSVIYDKYFGHED